MAGSRKFFTYLFILLLAAIISISYWKIQQDDAYIFYTYAKNIAGGNGYVFNQGEKLNATTSPLYTLLLALFTFIFGATGLAVPVIAHIIGAFSLLFSSYLMLKIFERGNDSFSSLLLPLLFLINPLLKNAVGMETFLYIAFILAALFYYKNGKYNTASVFLAFGTLTRFDGLLFTGVIFADSILRKNKNLPIKPIIIYLFIILPWFLFSKFYFGALFPSTVFAKISQQQMGNWGTGMIFIKGITSAFAGNKLISCSIIILAIFSFILILFKERNYFNEVPVRVISVWSLFYFFTYGFILNPPPYLWYYTPFVIIISLIFTEAIQIIFTEYIHLSRHKMTIVLLVITFTGLILPLKTLCNKPTPKLEKYKSAAVWLNNNAHNGASVAVDEIGIMGYYYKKGKIIDILGLINPDVIPHLMKCEYTWYIYKYKPDYIITDYPTPPKYSRVIFADDFRKAYSTSVIIKSGNNMSILFCRR